MFVNEMAHVTSASRGDDIKRTRLEEGVESYVELGNHSFSFSLRQQLESC